MSKISGWYIRYHNSQIQGSGLDFTGSQSLKKNKVIWAIYSFAVSWWRCSSCIPIVILKIISKKNEEDEEAQANEGHHSEVCPLLLTIYYFEEKICRRLHFWGLWMFFIASIFIQNIYQSYFMTENKGRLNYRCCFSVCQVKIWP